MLPHFCLEDLGGAFYFPSPFVCIVCYVVRNMFGFTAMKLHLLLPTLKPATPRKPANRQLYSTYGNSSQKNCCIYLSYISSMQWNFFG